jgi:hypothetical protein
VTARTLECTTDESTMANDRAAAGTQSNHWLLVFVFMLLIFTAATQPITDPDFWWHLRTGQYIVETRSIPHTDIFSSLHFGKEWITHEWLSEVVMYSIFHRLGYGGLIVLFSILITSAFFLIYQACRHRNVNAYIAGFASLLGAAATMPTWGVRPQMFSLFFASVFVSVLNGYYRDKSKFQIWWLVPLTILWVNMHAGFAAGVALIILVIAALITDRLILRQDSRTDLWQRIRPLCLLLVICLAAVFINPNGARMYSYPFETLKSSAMMQYIEEWKSPDFHNPLFQALALLLFAILSVLALSPKRVRPGELLLLIFTGWGTLRSARNVSFFSLVATPLLAEHVSHWFSTHKHPRTFRVAAKPKLSQKSLRDVVFALVLLTLGLLVVGVGVRRAMIKQPETEVQEFPSAAVDFMQTHAVPQPIYNEYVWGGYLIWRIYPEYRVYIDGRADVYGDDFVKEFLDIHDGSRMWREILYKRGIRTVLVKPNVALASLLRQDANWQEAFEDTNAVIFVRR